jgi:hypothetical protein
VGLGVLCNGIQNVVRERGGSEKKQSASLSRPRSDESLNLLGAVLTRGNPLRLLIAEQANGQA